MFELVVASGKGGTGKTSLTGALAEVASPAVLVDCDVDAADLHLIVPHRVCEEHDFSCSSQAVINMDACTACGICRESCRFEAITMSPDPETTHGLRFAVEPTACEGCGLCVHLCPTDTIRFGKVNSGKWFRSEGNRSPFYHARLGIAQSNSGRLVSLLRQEARAAADREGLDLILVDGPPGIGCPTIAALTGSSYLLIITEPSRSAIHDMERLVSLAEHFHIPAGVCLNKCDISEEMSGEVERFVSERGLTLHASIPYDPAFTQAQIRRQSYVAFASGGREMIHALWQSIRDDADRLGRTGGRRFAV
ncbi:ATP-binding protein [bacterium]|nr:ATP-binding protein [bacterium]